MRRIRTPAETQWTGTPATVHLSGLDTGALTAHVVDRRMQPSRRFTRKADDLPWSVLAHASSVVTRGRLAPGSHGLRWRAREGPFDIPGPGWPGAVSSVADPAGRRSHLPRSGRPARAALTAGGSLTPANAPQWPQEPLSRHAEGEKVFLGGYHPPDLRRAVGVCWRVEAQRLGPLSPAGENVHTMESVPLTQKRDGKASGSQRLTATTGDDGAGRATFTGVVTRHTRRLRAAHREEGAAALTHGNRARRPANAMPDSVITRPYTWLAPATGAASTRAQDTSSADAAGGDAGATGRKPSQVVGGQGPPVHPTAGGRRRHGPYGRGPVLPGGDDPRLLRAAGGVGFRSAPSRTGTNPGQAILR